jgi:septum formation protein
MPEVKRKLKWVLASASPRRKEILRRLGMRFRVGPGDIPEPARNPGESPSAYVVRVARMKAREVAKRLRSGFVIGADTVVLLKDSILGKPSNRVEARRMLKRLSGRWHEVLSGICLLDCRLKRARAACSRSRVHFRRLSRVEIEWYLKTGEYRDKAGAYGVQGFASLFIDRIEGCYFNIVGFPVSTFEKLCREFGIDLTAQLIRNSKFRIRDSKQSPMRLGRTR